MTGTAGTAARVGLGLEEPLLGSVAFGEETAVCFKIGLGAAAFCFLAFACEERPGRPSRLPECDSSESRFSIILKRL
jgi:hypothetical protein